MNAKLVEGTASSFLSLCKRAPRVIMLGAQISSSLPQFRKEFLIERLTQIADAFRPAGALFGAHHTLNHLDVMRTPQREVLVVFQKHFRQLIFLLELLMREHLDQGALPLAIVATSFLRVARRVNGGRVKSSATEQSKVRFGKRRRVHARLQTLAGKIVLGKLAQNRLVLQAGRKLDLAKLH